MIMVLTVAVIALSVVLSVRKEKPVVLTPGSCYANCPNGWVGFGTKCFYFSRDMENWTFSQTYCMGQAAQLARFDSLEELNFMKRYAGIYCYWIGLYRETSKHPWKWIDNTEYNNLEPVIGGARYGSIQEHLVTNHMRHIDYFWICSKLNSHTLHYSMSIIL
ncbi:C-type lectin domain family 2 member E [Lemmus lemmus]